MKFIFEPVTFSQAKQFLNCRRKTDILVGTNYLTSGDSLKLTIDELNELLMYKDTIKVSLKVNRLFHEDEIEKLIETLKQIKLEKVKFILYSDLGLLDVFEELNISNKAVYDAYTYTTNKMDVLEYSKYNEYVVVSNQISVDELKDLTNQINKNVIIYGFGKSVVFYSKRPLLTNYFKYRDLGLNPFDKDYNLKEEFREELYHIYEDIHGAYVYESKHYYLMSELKELNNVDYVIINSATLNATTYKKVVDSYLNMSEVDLVNTNILLYKGIMESKSVLLKSEVTNNE